MVSILSHNGEISKNDSSIVSVLVLSAQKLFLNTSELQKVVIFNSCLVSPDKC